VKRQLIYTASTYELLPNIGAAHDADIFSNRNCLSRFDGSECSGVE